MALVYLSHIPLVPRMVITSGVIQYKLMNTKSKRKRTLCHCPKIGKLHFRDSHPKYTDKSLLDRLIVACSAPCTATRVHVLHIAIGFGRASLNAALNVLDEE